jgi:hypothetical protein
MEPAPREEKPSERFVAAMKKIVSIPKQELRRREAEYQKQRSEKQKHLHETQG